MYVKCFSPLSFMECGTPFTKHLKNYALCIFFPICVTFGIKSTHFVKKKKQHNFSNRVMVSINVNKLL